MEKKRLIQMADDISDRITVLDVLLNGQGSDEVSPNERRCIETEYYALLTVLSAYNTIIMSC